MGVSRARAIPLCHRFIASATIAAAITLCATVIASPSTDAAHVGLHLPAPAGTEWEVAAGYNTTSHSAPNPYELDIVRTDDETAGTAVLAPVAGTVGYNSGDCITIRTDGIAVLLCHLFFDANINSGVDVALGQRIGVVAPAGAAGNNGLAHIHIAVHEMQRYSFGLTLPLIGPYAIEGREFPAATEWNAYAGTTFTSTNVVAAAPTPAPEPKTGGGAAASGSAELIGFEPQGRGLVVAVAGGSTEALLAAMEQAGADIASCSIASLIDGAWVVYIPAAPAAVNATWWSSYPAGLPPFTPLFSRCE